ncbi:MAG: sulfurtransferase/chromate resistance protein [Pseudomonadota bacterium]
MARFNCIAANTLDRLIGTPAAPAVVDVRLEEDVAQIPFLIPTAIRCAHSDVANLCSQLGKRSTVLVCHKGLKLSHGAAAILRSFGVRAEVLEGGMMGWSDAKLPALQLDRFPTGAPGSLWVTRQRPKIDRVACPWLIRRFVDVQAKFLFVPASEVLAVADRFDAIPFDVSGAVWSHEDDKCTFDSLLNGFSLHSPALDRMAHIIRGADTNTHSLAPESAGLLAFSVGLSRSYSDDLEQLEAGLPMYDALYRWARDGQRESHDWPGQHI